MPVTIRQVAEAAGVSTAAVSKVLHGRGDSVRVGVESAARIREAATRLQYRPNVLARNLRIRRTHTVGLVLEDFGTFAAGPLYYTHLLEGVGQTLFGQHYRLTILPELASDDVLGSLGDGQLEGVVWCKLPQNPANMSLIRECPIPIVAMNTPVPAEESGAVFVSCDNEGGIELVVQHLVEIGHRKIGFVFEQQETKTPDRIARLQGFEKAIAKFGIEMEILKWEWTLHEFIPWWESKPDCTALVCWSERTAGTLLHRASEIGVEIPRQLSVAGFDSTQYCETTHPRLTAVRQPITEMAKHATNILLDLINGQKPETTSFIFPCTLDVRDSTAPPTQS